MRVVKLRANQIISPLGGLGKTLQTSPAIETHASGLMLACVPHAASPAATAPPKHPKAPKMPQEVSDVAKNAVRQADYKRKYDEYLAEAEEHKKFMKERRRQQVMVTNVRRASVVPASSEGVSMPSFRDASWPWAEWVNDLEYYAHRCGAGQAPQLWAYGMWYDVVVGVDRLEGSGYIDEDRPIQFGICALCSALPCATSSSPDHTYPARSSSRGHWYSSS
jgi:hypothetical protein